MNGEVGTLIKCQLLVSSLILGLSSCWTALNRLQSNITYTAKQNFLLHQLRLFLPLEQLCLQEMCVLLKLKSASRNLSSFDFSLSSFAFTLLCGFLPLPLPYSLLLIFSIAAVYLHDYSTSLSFSPSFLTLFFSFSHLPFFFSSHPEGKLTLVSPCIERSLFSLCSNSAYRDCASVTSQSVIQWACTSLQLSNTKTLSASWDLWQWFRPLRCFTKCSQLQRPQFCH